MTESRVRIYKGQDFYVPYFTVSVGDAALPALVIHDITQVSYTDSVDEIDHFEITINNWDARTLTFKYSDSHQFDPGKKVALWMGYFGQDQLMCVGEITSLHPSFPSGGQPTLVIRGLNSLHKLRKKQQSISYKTMKDSEIARQIGDRLGVHMTTNNQAEEKEERHNYLLQDSQYDIMFLLQRARHLGYDLYVLEDGRNGSAKPTKIYFGPSQKVRPTVFEIEYGKSLIEFQPNLSTANQVGKVTVRGWDAVRKQPIEVSVTPQDLDTKGVGEKGGQAEISRAYQDREEVISNVPVNTVQEARTLGTQTLQRTAKEMLTGSGSIVGLPDLRAGTVVYLRGLGNRFSGRYFVTGSNHTIGEGGYTTHFDCRREELKKG